MKLKAKGFGRHRFWGEYSMLLVLQFESREEALLALPVLNKNMDFGTFLTAGGCIAISEGWRHICDAQGEAAQCLYCDAGTALDAVIARLVGYGAEEKKITSMAHSIDYCETYHIEMEVPDPNQKELL